MKKKWVVLAFIPFLIIPLFASIFDYRARALEEYCKGYDNYNINVDSDGTTEGNKKAIWSYLKSVGFSEEAAAGVMGNIQAESGFNPARLQGDIPESQFTLGSTGFGLVQWTYSGYQKALFNYAKSKGKDKKDLSLQLDFLYNEQLVKHDFMPYFTGIEELKKSSDIRKVTEVFMLKFERPYDQSENAIANRTKLSQGIYEQLRGKTGVVSVSRGRNMLDGRVFWLGDSRFVGMEQAKKTDKDIYIAKGSMGYKWFVSDAIPRVNKEKKSSDTIVFGFGVNDLSNVNKYIDKLNELKQNEWKANKVIVLSVNPVIEGKSTTVTNAQIDDFNSQLEFGLINGIQYINTNAQIKDSIKAEDGLHYDKSTYIKIYNLVRSTSSNNSYKAMVCPSYVSGGKSKLAGKPKFDIKIWQSSDNPYINLAGQCTWFVWGKLKEVYGISLNWSANGADWVDRLTTINSDRWIKSDKPKAGAIYSVAATESNSYGHVGIVVAIKGDKLICQEGNINQKTDDFSFAIKENTNGKLGEEANGDWWEHEYTLASLKKTYGKVTFANPR